MDSGNPQDFEYRILCALRRIIRSVDIYSRKLYTEHGLTTPQLLCLHSMSQPVNMTLSELAESVNLGTSTVNGIVDRLEARQYVVRNRSTEDRRKVYIQITQAGRDVATRAPYLLQDKLSVSLAKLDVSEQLIITKSLETVVESMEVKEVDASPNLISTAHIAMESELNTCTLQ